MGECLSCRVGGKRQTCEPAAPVDAGGPLRTPLGNEPGELAHAALEVAALSLEVRELLLAQPLEVENGVFGQHPRQSMAEPAVRSFLGRRVLVLVVQQVRGTVGAKRPKRVEQEAREALPVDREESLGLIRLA